MSLISSDIFNRRPLQFGGAFAADSARINLDFGACLGFNPDDEPGMLVQNLTIQYQQPITRLYSVGSQLTFYVAGRPQGNATLARVLGPGVVATSLYACLGDVCNADTNDLCFCLEANCLGNQSQDFDDIHLCVKNVVLQSLGFSVQAENMVINEQMSLFFTALIAEDDLGGCQFEGVQGVTCGCL
jgi:hypothetical protein